MTVQNATRIFMMILLLCGAGSCGSMDKKTATGSSVEQASLSTHVSKAIASPADPIRFEIKLQTDPDLNLDIPQVGDRIRGFRIINEGKTDPHRVGGQMLRSRWYDLRADIVGSYLLPAVEITYESKDGKKTLKAPQIFVEVKLDAKVGEQEEAKLRDIKPLIKRQMPLTQKLLWIVLPLLILALIAGGIFFAKRWSGKTVAAEEHLTPDAWAIRELDEFKRRFQNLELQNLEQRKKYYFRLSEIFRGYLEKRFAFPAVDLTTEEILPRLKKERQIPSESLSNAHIFLQGTDFVKFTDLLPSEKDPEKLLQIAYDFVSRTRPLPPEPLEGTVEELRARQVAAARGRSANG